MPLLLPFILFCVLVFLSISKLFKYFKTRDKAYLKKAVMPWVYVIVVIGSFNLLFLCIKSDPIDKNEIVGFYEIDEKFYPGTNANWQKEHFRFQVTHDDKFIFYEKLADHTERQFVGSIKWAHENPEKWSINMENPHHVIDKHPVLYRKSDGKEGAFYYVFQSKYFGNMFFNKVKNGS